MVGNFEIGNKLETAVGHLVDGDLVFVEELVGGKADIVGSAVGSSVGSSVGNEVEGT